ncbi:hypothetical protein A4X13_0g851 [Tilletia indica]|uniref:Uncharacterized protein n=1 Tax=Tilletia indica TaxID=43049 RepID=A0A177TGK6_9BASI|nr:hypothetical protein A4X13_0g851 [Tilletia indica]
MTSGSRSNGNGRPAVGGGSGARDGQTAAEEDFDTYVAGLVLADAKGQQAENERGPLKRSYLDPSAASGSGPKATNKRFLANVIRGVDSHNKTVIRQQLQAADEASARRAREGGARASPALAPTDRRDAQDGTRSHTVDPGGLSIKGSGASRPRRPPTELVLPETGSKMDKYFESSYDPALDIDMSRLEDANTGLIGELPRLLLEAPSHTAKPSGSESAKWSEMLSVVKQRDADKAARKADRAQRRAKKAERTTERERERNGDRARDSKRSGREWDQDKIPVASTSKLTEKAKDTDEERRSQRKSRKRYDSSESEDEDYERRKRKERAHSKDGESSSHRSREEKSSHRHSHRSSRRSRSRSRSASPIPRSRRREDDSKGEKHSHDKKASASISSSRDEDRRSRRHTRRRDDSTDSEDEDAERRKRRRRRVDDEEEEDGKSSSHRHHHRHYHEHHHHHRSSRRSRSRSRSPAWSRSPSPDRRSRITGRDSR